MQHTHHTPQANDTRKHSHHERSAGRRAKGGLRFLALAALLLATTTAAESCGETTSHPTASTTTSSSAASTPTGDATPAATTTAGTTASTPSHNTSAATTGSGDAGSSGSGHAHAHMVLPSPNSRPAPKLSASERENLPLTDITLTSPGLTRGAPSLAATYTCQGADSSPPLHWSAPPAGTQELALFAINTKPVNGKLYFDWALAGIKPTLTSLQPGQTPAGAVQGQNSHATNTYTLCPPTTGHETYVFVLYALPATLNPKPGFNPTTLREQALHTSRHTGLLAVTQ